MRNIKHLHTLILDETAITDAGLKQLRDLTELRDLRIDTPGVSDAGARALADAIKGLTIVRRTDKERFLDELRLVGGKSDGEEVDLAGTKINDTWLMQLRTLPNLKIGRAHV